MTDTTEIPTADHTAARPGGRVPCTVRDAVATVVLDNPGRRNAVSFPIFTELAHVLGDLGRREDVRVVVLTGAGEHFSVGADLAAPPESRTLRGHSLLGDTQRLRDAGGTARLLHELPQVTVAAIDGACAGAGLSLAAAADFRIASDRSVFHTAFLDAGLSGDLGAIWFLTQTLGTAAARRLFLDPTKLTADHAELLGVVDRVVAAADFRDEVDVMVHRIAGRAPVALRAMKENLLHAAVAPLPEYLDAEARRMAACAHTDDAREAAAAFLAKRAPEFTGR